ncbi:hypothetical protein BS17DRAFT_214488 [Gyrodon lividus]|nr:hypothetical protein BS17DRAFT_214488 [Gyrodon lividus]
MSRPWTSGLVVQLSFQTRRLVAQRTDPTFTELPFLSQPANGTSNLQQPFDHLVHSTMHLMETSFGQYIRKSDYRHRLGVYKESDQTQPIAYLQLPLPLPRALLWS